MPQLLQKKYLIPWLMKLSDEIFHAPRWRKLERTLSSSSAGRPDYFFLQIGANDGITHDRLHDFVVAHRWAGILVEPVPHYFRKLRENYADSPGPLIFENVAIGETEGVREIYRIRENVAHLPAWVHGMATLDRQILLNHKWAIPNIEEYIVEEQIRCITLETLLARHNVKHLDLLAVDTEGHDYTVIRQLDFTRFRPSIVTYEHKHLTRHDRAACETLLRDNGYTTSRMLGNTLAIGGVG